MNKISPISITIKENITDLGTSRLEFNISGDDINYVVLNTIRRTILTDIPIYAFNEFKFEKNTSIYHNNYLKLRFSNIPVWGIENTLEFIDTNEENNQGEQDIEEGNYEEEQDDVELDKTEKLNVFTLKQLTMYVNYKNKTDSIVSVTTDDAKFYYEQKQIKSPYKEPILLVKLQPKQEISFSAITKIGTEYSDAIYSPVSIICYKQNSETDFNFVLESRGQITEKRILQVAILNIERKLKRFLKLINEKKESIEIDKERGLLIIHNEDHTLGNLISRGLQQHNKISFAGYNLPHPLAEIVQFHYKMKKEGDIKTIFKDVIDYYLDLFADIKKKIDSKL